MASQFTLAQISRAGVRYVYALGRAGQVLALEQAYDCGHGGALIRERLDKAGYPSHRSSQAAWADRVRRAFLAQHDPQA